MQINEHSNESSFSSTGGQALAETSKTLGCEGRLFVIIVRYQLSRDESMRVRARNRITESTFSSSPRSGVARKDETINIPLFRP